MSPELRAAADSFIYDVAMLLHVMDSLGDDGMGLTCEATGWTLRQTLGHVAASYERYSGSLSRRLAGQYAPWEPVSSAETAAAERGTPADVLAERMFATRASTLASLADFTPGQESGPLAEGFPPLREVVEAWSRHGSAHAIDFVEAMPGLADDALILGWVFHPRQGEDTSLPARRDALLEQLKKARRNANE